MPFRRPEFFSTALCLLLCAGCKDRQIATYRVPKEAPPAINLAASAGGALRWEKPAGWQEQPDATGVRKASFVVTGEAGAKADVSVTSFPGDVGGELANINRWRGQVKLPPVTEEGLPDLVKKLSTPAGEFSVLELEGTGDNQEPTRILGAILKQPDQTWFFKMTGRDALVAAQRENFRAFLQSVQFTDASSPSGAPPFASGTVNNTNDLPRHTAEVPLAVAAPTASGGDLTWTKPAAWQEKPLGSMRRGSFTVPGAGGEGDLSIIAFPGEAGGDLPNLNRWRGQVGLPPMTAADLPRETTALDRNGLHFTVVDFAGTTSSGPTRIVGALTAHGGQTWFFKLMGPDATVVGAKADFLAFLQTVKEAGK